MASSPDEMPPAGEPGPDCFDIATFEEMVLTRSTPRTGPIANHLNACSRCRGLLEEMRADHAFLARFSTGADDEGDLGLLRPEPTESHLVRVDGYEVESLISHGGQGAVYKARQLGTGRHVAIKVPIRDTKRHPSIRYRFKREIELTARLDHPGIVRVFGDCELEDGRLGCVMEYVVGETIDRWTSKVRREPRDGVHRIIEVMARVADAIAYAHQRAVLHRDIKPSNVIVTEDGVPHVLDFGLAKALDGSDASFATVTGAFLGTLVFAAPEQVSGSQDSNDLRTDVYALGLLLFQSLTGRLPFATDLPTAAIVENIRFNAPPRPSSLAPQVDEELDAIVLKALAKEKQRRYATAGDFRDDLSAWLDGRAVRARFDSRWYVLRKAVARRKGLVTGVVLGLAALVAMGVLGLKVRDQAAQSRLADAVRDARVLESHWARMAEARAIGADNFERGEEIAWDALLDPEPVLLREGLADVGDVSDALPASPAYWALWEMYQRTPVVYSVRAAPLRYPVFYGESHTLISYDAGQHRLDWRNWRSGRVTRSVNLPEIQDQTAISYVSADGSKVLLFAPRTFVLYLLDCSQMSVHRIRDQRPLVPLGMTSTRLLTLTRLENHTAEITLWDITQGDPTRITTLPTVGHEWTARFEISEKYGLAVENGGELFLLDAESGIMLLHRSAAEQPRYCRAHSRGTPGEFILAGMTHIGRIDMTRGSAIEILDPVTKMPFVGRARSLATTPGSNRMVLIMTDQRVGVGQSDQNPIRGEYIPSLTASAASLSRDGRHVALRSPVAHRMFIFDLQGDSPRRLHMRSELASPLGTLFAVEFSPDSRRLMAGAMTGDIECFDITTGDSWPVVGAPIAGGVTRLCTAGGDLFVGTHELGQRNARVLRVRDGQSEVLTGGDLGHIAGLQADDANLWVLAGCGTLSRFDLRVGKAQARAKIPDLAGGAGVGRALARLPEYGVLIVSWSGDGLAVLDETTFNMLCTATVGAPRDIAVSPVDPTLVATSGEDGLIRLWRYRPGAKPRLEEFMTFGAHAGDTFTLTFSPDGRFLASGGGTVEARDVRIWSVAEGRQLAALDLFEQSVFGLAFSPDGRWLAAAGESGEEQDEGCQLYLIELHAPDRCIAGNLEYHIARFVQKYGHEPSQAATLRKWAGAIPKNHPQ